MTQFLIAGIPESIQSFLPLIGIVIVFYLFFIRPQNKQRKETQGLLDDMKKGDILVTAGGIHGKMLKDNGNTLVIEIDTHSKIKVEKSSISLELTKTAREAKTVDKV